MPGPSRTPRGPSPPPESYAKLVGNVLGVALVLSLMALARWLRAPSAPLSAPPAATSASAPAPAPVVKRAAPAPAAPEPGPPSAPSLDRAAVARAEAEVAAARAARDQAEARACAAAEALAAATTQAARAARDGRTLASRLRDPSARIRRAQTRGAALRAERDRLQTELAGLAKAPRPKRKQLIDRTPVAQPAAGEEYHFELRRNRVSFIDLDKLLELAKNDAQMRIRFEENNGRPIASSVGPVGSFSLHYVLIRTLPATVEDLIESRGPTYSLRAWEVVPETDGRGEPYDMALQPAANFARVIHRLNPNRATITLWVYPDSFTLYRQLRDLLHQQGFLVAARPLPEGMPIRGSPAGSLSAGQ
jgi:hypothetical protein